MTRLIHDRINSIAKVQRKRFGIWWTIAKQSTANLSDKAIIRELKKKVN